MFSSEQWLANSGANFYNGVATQSLRFNDNDSAYLTRTPSSAGNRLKWTWSGWFKRTAITASHTTMFMAGSNGSNDSQIYWTGTKFRILNSTSNSTNTLKDSVAEYRDTSAWYNFTSVWDTAQSDADDRVRQYVNGKRITDFGSNTKPSQNATSHINNNVAHRLGAITNNSSYFDGYMAEVNFLDGYAIDETDGYLDELGEVKNGVWIAKEYTGSYGTNGFRLQFNQNGVGTASTSTIGADTSGNTNHWTSSGIVASDCAMPDSPENNFATLNPMDNKGQTLSEGNLKFYNNASSHISARGNFGMVSGKWYFECSMSSIAGGDQQQFGVARQNVTAPASGATSDAFIMYWSGGNPGNNYIYNNGSNSGNTSLATAVGDVLKCSYDADTGKLWLGKNTDYYTIGGAIDGSANPATGTNPTMTLSETEPLVAWVHSYSNAGTYNICNFGQDSSFAGNKTAQGNTDANGIGDFYYAPPSGFLALCTSNLPEPTIGANSDTQADDHFYTVLYTGNATARSITGLDFQPDLTWIKARSATTQHTLVDSIRGTGNWLESNATAAEQTGGAPDAFNSDGFDLTTWGQVNGSGVTFVSWNWKANGGTTSSNTSGTITSTVQANTDAGFSIVSYTGNGTTGSTIGHGLNQTPELQIIARRDSTNYWMVTHKDVTAGSIMHLYSTLAAYGTSNAISLGTTVWTEAGGGGYSNVSGGTYVAYNFHSVEGYSKIGSYTANNSTDGPFVYCGFRPAFVITKGADYAVDWFMFDAQRDVDNVVREVVYSNSSAAEASGDSVDFLSNGFKVRNSGAGGLNYTGTYIFIAFAETPFKYANAR